MLLVIPQVLSADHVRECRQLVEAATWVDGKVTAGTQSGQVKHNQQLPEDDPNAMAARNIILQSLGICAPFITAALPRKIFPPLFNRYSGQQNQFGNHIDNAIRTSSSNGQWVRTDLSATLFLAEPDEYEGGELVIEDTYGSQRIKLAAGDMVLYPSSSVHRVEPVTRGARLASFFWIESMVRSDEQRRLLYDLDMAILSLRAQSQAGDSTEVVQLTGCYHNLLRMWATT
ncbi:Fe2+-dependent dioxygenase [Parvibium lacunae]|uniref:Fe2+-dependent dioxygenase n=1 Tax=Parvibium lacunae TaxID=1888893 RepID=A0A368L482_9BURK|nr:Fe2+-dependent dioxygenase [Parvibium lacunae]RCS58379.1 Fe2+-dependent dioxygenase [Parvibium lacunae]